jgi:hypothetical protein
MDAGRVGRGRNRAWLGAVLVAAFVASGLGAGGPAGADPGIDLALEFGPAAEWVKAGTTAEFPLTITNTGTAATTGSIVVTIDVTNLENIRATVPSGSKWTCVPDEDFLQIVCTRTVAVAPGAAAPLITVKGGVIGEYPESVDVSADVTTAGDVDASDDVDDAASTIRPAQGVGISVAGPLHPLVAGEPFTGSMTVRNVGYQKTQGDMTVGWTAIGLDVVATGNGWSCDADFEECVTSAQVSSGGSFPKINFTGTVTGAIGTEASLMGVLWNDNDETFDDDQDIFAAVIESSDTTPPGGLGITKITHRSVRTSKTMEVGWKASDPSGISAYDVQKRTAAWNGSPGAWNDWQTGVTTTSATWVGTYGRTYCFRVRATDGYANTSEWSTPVCTAVPLRSADLAYSAGWTVQARPAAFTGVVRRTTVYAAKATRTSVQATRLALVVTKCPSCGIVRVSRNGSKLADVNLYSSVTRSKQLVTVKVWSTPQTGTITITLLTGGRPALLEGLGVYQE